MRYLAALLLATGLVGVFVARAVGSTSAPTVALPVASLPPQTVGGPLQAAAQTRPDPHALQLFETVTLPNGQKLPSIVARFGHTDITARALVHQIALITDNTNAKHLNWSQSQIWHAALNVLIQDAALYERAKQEGITVSDAELMVLVASQEAALAQSELADPTVAPRVQAAIAAAGDADYASYMKDPKILDMYRRDLMKAKLVDAHVGKSASPDAVNRFIADTIAQANVQLFIQLPG